MEWQVSRNGTIERITVRRPGLFKGREIWFGQERLGAWPSTSEFLKGVTFKTQDGSSISFQMKYFPIPGAIVKFNGETVSGSAEDPNTKIQVAYTIMGGVSGFHLLFGYLAFFWHWQFLEAVGFGSYNFQAGGFLLGLFLVGQSQKKFWPLALGLILFMIDTVFMAEQIIQLNVGIGPGPLFVRLMLMALWLNGVLELYKREKMNSPEQKLC